MGEKKKARWTDTPGGGRGRLGCGLLGRVLVEQGGPAKPAQLQRSPRASASGGAVSRKRRPRSEGHLLLRALCARVGEDVAAFRGRATRKCHNQAFFGVVLGKVGRHRQEGLGVDRKSVV